MKKFRYNIEKRNQFLEDIGLKPHEYGVNFTEKKDKRRKQWKKEQRKYGFDSRETWNLNNQYAQWLYSHLKLYLKETKEVIDLDYYKIQYEGEEYTQKEAIKKMIKYLEYYLKNADKLDDKKVLKAEKMLKKASELWVSVLPYMWW